MKSKSLTLLLFSLGLIAIMMLSGCGGSSSSTSPSTTPVDVTGTWNVGSDGLGALVLTLAQDVNGNITGTATRTADAGTITGSNISNNITLTITFPDGMILTMTGVVSDNNNMSGTYNDNWGQSNNAAWSATRAS